MFNKAEGYYNKALFLAPNLPLGYIEKARNAKLSGQYEKALAFLREIFISNIENKEISREFNDIFIVIKDPKKKIHFYYSLFQEKPQNIIIRHQLAMAYIVYAETLYRDKHMGKALENYEKALKLEPDNNEIYSSIIYNQLLINKSVVALSGDLSLDRDNPVCTLSKKTILENNLNELVKICKKNNIELIFSGYPLEVPGPVQKVSAESGIHLIDHRQSFPDATGDFFAPDGHCNSAGYKVIVENLAEYILYGNTLKNGDK